MAKLIEHIPRYYINSKVAKDITTPIDLENESFIDMINDYKNQFIVSTATFALGRYEKQYGLPINPDGITLEERRSRIKAKMRMVGPVNKQMLQNVINAWTNADAEIIEDFSNYTVTIKFVNTIGIPSNMQDVYDAIDEIMPTHLIVKYEFKYNTVKDLRLIGWTVKQLADRGKTVLQLVEEKL